MKTFFKVVAYSLLGLFLLGVVAAMFSDDKAPSSGSNSSSAASEPADAPEHEPLPEVTARELAQAYDENTVAADTRFKGLRFRVSGVVTDINTDFMGDPVIVLRGGVNQFMEPQFGFDKKAAQALAQVRKGSTVTMECEGKGDVAKTPMSDDCELVN